MKKILFVGDHPLGRSGNSNMMRAILERVDTKLFKVACFATYQSQPILSEASMHPLSVNVIQATAENEGKDYQKLLGLIEAVRPNAVIFIGLDIWAYVAAFNAIGQLRDSLKFKCAAIFPYDLQYVRKDWVSWINFFDVPKVYSRYGYEALKKHVPGIKYFRPPLYGADSFRPMKKEGRRMMKERFFPSAKERFMFGFVGVNQHRKDPVKALEAFGRIHEKYPETAIYLHTKMEHGPYNLVQMSNDLGLERGSIFHAEANIAWLNQGQMSEIYNSMDCFVNTSLQEGLSWTLLEAMLSGTPVIATDTTAQTELIRGVGSLVKCESPSYLPLPTSRGISWLPAKSCEVKDVAEAMERMITDDAYRERCQKAGLKRARQWVRHAHNINDLIEETLSSSTLSSPSQLRKKEVIFAQHSAAGDVLMTTRCLKGIRERHPDMKIVYMTSPQYMKVVLGNPYIDDVIPWDQDALKRYEIVYNPHGERILPGHWGRNSNSILSDFYWKILNVEPCDFYVNMKEPVDIFIKEDGIVAFTQGDSNKYREIPLREICVVHTTGGDPHFRTYKYMGDVCKALEKSFSTIQVGGANDYPADADIDLRGKLSFAESAWVMSRAKVAVTVDSFISHLAGALGISQVCLFGSGNAFVVRPNQVKGRLICMVPDYVRDCPGLGPCSASVRDCPAPCTGRHDPKRIVDAINDILNQDSKDGAVEFRYEDDAETRRLSFA